MPLAAIAAIGVAGSIGGADIASHGASSAANAQVNAADYAANLQHQDAEAALDFQKQQFGYEQQIEAPYLQTGDAALKSLGDLTSGNATINEQNDPGYQFRLQQGEQALQRSAAAKGNLFTGGTAKAITDYAQNDASNEFQNTFNRYLSLAGLGQNATNTTVSAANSTGNSVAGTLLASGQQLANDAEAAGAARASGYAANGNIWGQALGNLGGDATQSILLSKLLGGSSGSSGSGFLT